MSGFKRGRGKGRPRKGEYVNRPFPVDPLIEKLREELISRFGQAGWSDIARKLRNRLRVVKGVEEQGDAP